MGQQLGMNCVLKYKAGGIGGGGAWTPANNVKDASLNMSAAEADVTTRGNAGWEATVPTLRTATVEFDMVWDEADPFFTAIKNAFLTNVAAEKAIGIQALSALTGGQGLQADMAVSEFTRNEELREAVTVSVTLKITYSATPPSWINS